jgi:hypothetical protein
LIVARSRGNPGYKGRLLESSVEAFINALETINRLSMRYRVETFCAGCCYEVSRERVDLFSQAFPGFKDMYEERGGELFLDIKTRIRADEIDWLVVAPGRRTLRQENGQRGELMP